MSQVAKDAFGWRVGRQFRKEFRDQVVRLVIEAHAVDRHHHQVEAIEGDALPGRELRRTLPHKAPADGAVTGAPALHRRPDRFQAPRVLACRDGHRHLLDDAPVERTGRGRSLERRQRDLTSRGGATSPLCQRLTSIRPVTKPYPLMPLTVM